MRKWKVYEDKKVDYLVATDAIGMGLNLKYKSCSLFLLSVNLMDV